MGVTVDRDVASSWETFRLWRVSDSEFQLRTSQWQSLTWDDERMAWGIRLLFPHLSYLLSAATSIPSPNKPIIISTAHVSITFHLHVYFPNFQIPIIHHSFPAHAYHHTPIIHFSYHFISSPIHHLFPHSSTISNPLRFTNVVSQEQEILRTWPTSCSLTHVFTNPIHLLFIQFRWMTHACMLILAPSEALCRRLSFSKLTLSPHPSTLALKTHEPIKPRNRFCSGNSARETPWLSSIIQARMIRSEWMYCQLLRWMTIRNEV